MQQQVGDKIKEDYETSFRDFQYKLQILDDYYLEQKKLYDERPSRDEDREQIKQLQQDVQDRDFEIILKNEQIKNLQQELLNREMDDPNIAQQNVLGFNQIEDKKVLEIKYLKQQLQTQEDKINRLNERLIDRDNSQNQFFNSHSQLYTGIWNQTNNDKQPLGPRRSHIILKQ